MTNRTCTTDGCDRERKARGLCAMHYKRVNNKRTKYPIVCVTCGADHLSERRDGKFCSDDCKAARYRERYAKPALSKLPASHPVRKHMAARDAAAMWSPLRRAFETGDHDEIIAEVHRGAAVTESGCWEWQGRASKDGYPTHRFGKREVSIHRLVVEAKYRAPLGKQAAHHACANTMCVNPDHLQPVTARENTAEMLARTYMVARITDLEEALRALAPDHPLLAELGLAA